MEDARSELDGPDHIRVQYQPNRSILDLRSRSKHTKGIYHCSNMSRIARSKGREHVTNSQPSNRHTTAAPPSPMAKAMPGKTGSTLRQPNLSTNTCGTERGARQTIWDAPHRGSERHWCCPCDTVASRSPTSHPMPPTAYHARSSHV